MPDNAILSKLIERSSLPGRHFFRSPAASCSPFETDLPEIRQDIGNMKKSRGWDNGKGDALEVNTPAASTNIYSRKRGDTAFLLLASKRKRFPFIDDTPPTNPELPEEREYQIILVIGDNEIGLPSDIATAVWRP